MNPPTPTSIQWDQSRSWNALREIALQKQIGEAAEPESPAQAGTAAAGEIPAPSNGPARIKMRHIHVKPLLKEFRRTRPGKFPLTQFSGFAARRGFAWAAANSCVMQFVREYLAMAAPRRGSRPALYKFPSAAKKPELCASQTPRVNPWRRAA